MIEMTHFLNFLISWIKSGIFNVGKLRQGRKGDMKLPFLYRRYVRLVLTLPSAYSANIGIGTVCCEYVGKTKNYYYCQSKLSNLTISKAGTRVYS